MFTKTSLHAIRAFMVLAELPEGAHAGAAAIAKEIGAPQNYLGKLLQSYIRENLVVSQKGLGGGFALARDASEISLFDVVNPIEDIAGKTGCILGRATCGDDNPCAVHESWGQIRDAYLKLLTETHIADLVNHGDLKHLVAQV